MSHRIEIKNDKIRQKFVIPVIAVEGDSICELCGKVEETRPYGPGGKRVCFDCGMKDEPTAQHNMKILLLGDKGELK